MSTLSNGPVLVVEDEPALLDIVTEILQDNGFRTLRANDAAEAIQSLYDNPGIKTVFADVRMPGHIDGLALVRSIRNHWPEVGIIVTSGKRAVETEDLPERTSFLQKPYTSEALLAALRKCETAT
jgi:DNA-binding NtrC family response regulator